MPIPSAKVLVVDDHLGFRLACALLLEGLGHRPHALASVPRALDAIAAERPDAVLSDLELPVVDGFHLLAELRQRGDGVPVVAMSAGHDGVLRRALDLGAVAALAKPFTPEELEHALRTALAPRLASAA